MKKQDLRCLLREFEDDKWIEESCSTVFDCLPEFRDMSYEELEMWAAQAAVIFNKILNENES